MTKHAGPILAQRDGLTVIDCRACGWAHLDPLPNIPAGYYESEFWATKGAGWLERYEAQREWLDMRHGDWLSVVGAHIKGRRLLDVGCGYGFLMAAAERAGWKADGIEPSLEAATYATAHCRGHVHLGGWAESDIPRYDCVSALWLIEHLPNPFEFLGWARAHLAPDGALLLCVPQEWTHLQTAANTMSKAQYWWVHPTHLHYWSAATFYGLLGRAGFRVVDALATFPIEQYVMMGSDYPADEALGGQVHAQIRAEELDLTRAERLARARRWAGRMGMGRDLVVIAK